MPETTVLIANAQRVSEFLAIGDMVTVCMPGISIYGEILDMSDVGISILEYETKNDITKPGYCMYFWGWQNCWVRKGSFSDPWRKNA